VLALIAVRAVAAGEKKLYIAGGRRLGRDFLDSLVLPAGMRVLLYDAAASVNPGDPLAPLAAEVRGSRREAAGAIGEETFQGIPLFARGEELLLAILLVGSSRQELASVVGSIRRTALAAGLLGVLVGVALSWWTAGWATELVSQRERLLQAERVAAWREVARRLAHELKNPLFPLQITVENLRKAKEQIPEQFDEVFRESAQTLLEQIASLKTIIGRFSDFARMPPPQLERTDVNAVVERTMKLLDPQLGAAGISTSLRLDPALPVIDADPEQLGRALQNLALNALDAMPLGGALTVRTGRRGQAVVVEVADTGAGLTPEERQRLFTPYYTTKQHGTGLGLAIVQSVVSDHGGRVTVESEPGRGTMFRLELPERRG